MHGVGQEYGGARVSVSSIYGKKQKVKNDFENIKFPINFSQ